MPVNLFKRVHRWQSLPSSLDIQIPTPSAEPMGTCHVTRLNLRFPDVSRPCGAFLRTLDSSSCATLYSRNRNQFGHGLAVITARPQGSSWSSCGQERTSSENDVVQRTTVFGAGPGRGGRLSILVAVADRSLIGSRGVSINSIPVTFLG